jgi:adenylate kinase
MNISLTGTPGTGKTSISRFLSQNDIKILDLKKLIFKENLISAFDKKRNTNIIDINKINKYFENNIYRNGILIIEGHLSHLLKCIDKVILLRCNPKELKIRLLKRRWNKKKIKENIESEILDIILCECLKFQSKKNIFEIDTTKMSVESLGHIILKIIENNFKQEKIYKIGQIDWSEEIFNIK